MTRTWEMGRGISRVKEGQNRGTDEEWGGKIETMGKEERNKNREKQH